MAKKGQYRLDCMQGGLSLADINAEIVTINFFKRYTTVYSFALCGFASLFPTYNISIFRSQVDYHAMPLFSIEIDFVSLEIRTLSIIYLKMIVENVSFLIKQGLGRLNGGQAILV
jgi:hypothetical protein